MNEIQKILTPEELVIWEGKPKFGPYFASLLLVQLIFGALLLIFAGFLYAIFFASGLVPTSALMKMLQTAFAIPFFIVLFWKVIGKPVYSIMEYRRVYYSITNRRVIAQSGLIGRDFKHIDLDRITDVVVNVGVWDKIFGNSGSVLVLSTTPITFAHVENPYEVYKLIKERSYELRSDMEFPNQLRQK